MFRKSALALAAIVALGGASIITIASDAQAAPGGHGGISRHGGFGGGFHRGGGFRGHGLHRPGLRHPGLVRWHGRHWHPHWHPRRVIWAHHYVRPIAVAPVVSTPVVRGPCTCLTKEYTLDGLVVFRDLCTTETASAQVPGAAPAPQQSSSAAPSNNFAGRSYQDFLAANGQTTQPAQN